MKHFKKVQIQRMRCLNPPRFSTPILTPFGGKLIWTESTQFNISCDWFFNRYKVNILVVQIHLATGNTSLKASNTESTAAVWVAYLPQGETEKPECDPLAQIWMKNSGYVW